MSARRDERGSMTVLYAAGAVMLTAVLSMGIDLAAMLALATNQNSAIQLAAAQFDQAGDALALKNSENPGHDLARAVIEALRSQGFDGRIEVDFYEPPAELLPTRTRRLMVYEVRTTSAYKTSFGAVAGVGDMAVGAADVFALSPYSDGPAWRPSASDCGSYSVADGERASAMSYKAKADLRAFSASLRDEASEQLGAMQQ